VDHGLTRQTVVVPAAVSIDRLSPWVLRLAWVGLLVVGDSAIDGATATRSDAIGAVALWGAGALWLAGVAAMAIPAVVSLTATRAVVPLSLPVAIVAWSAGAEPGDGTLLLGIAAVATVVALSGDLGRVFVQASAYGEEDRHLLRPPTGYLFAVLVSWAIWAAAAIGGPLLLGGRAWVLGGVVSGFAIVMTIWAWPRWHSLSRRWLVVVPIGLVVHDHLVMAETLMLRRQEIATARLAPAGTQAADLTGPAAGHAIEINTVETVTAILAATPKAPGGKAIHLTACLVAPTRPGRALAAAGRRRLPVG
jgi:hypothetical protein